MNDEPVVPWLERYFKDVLAQYEKRIDDRFKSYDRAIEEATRSHSASTSFVLHIIALAISVTALLIALRNHG